MSTLDQNTIQANEEDYLYINTSQITNAGKGLYTAIEIYKDEIIAQFKGEILSDYEAEMRVNLGLDSYFMNLPNGKILDCGTTFGFAKYANDASGFSQSKFKNNSKITLDENENVCLVAVRKITCNEEIFCNYGKRYWKKHVKDQNKKS